MQLPSIVFSINFKWPESNIKSFDQSKNEVKQSMTDQTNDNLRRDIISHLNAQESSAVSRQNFFSQARARVVLGAWTVGTATSAVLIKNGYVFEGIFVGGVFGVIGMSFNLYYFRLIILYRNIINYIQTQKIDILKHKRYDAGHLIVTDEIITNIRKGAVEYIDRNRLVRSSEYNKPDVPTILLSALYFATALFFMVFALDSWYQCHNDSEYQKEHRCLKQYDQLSDLLSQLQSKLWHKQQQ